MPTQWMTLTRPEPRSWLLANGEVITEPALETSGSGRKVRVAGTTESVFTAELPDLLIQAARSIAATKNTPILAEVTAREVAEQQALGFDTRQTKAELHYVHKHGDRWAGTTCWWRFKHPSIPFECVLTAQITYQHAVNVRMIVPVWCENDAYTRYVQPMPDFSNIFTTTSSYSPHGTEVARWREFIRDNAPSWDTSVLARSNPHPNPRTAVVDLLSVVREIETYESVQVPDLRDFLSPGWMDLELYETNVNNEFIADLVEYLDGGPAVEKLARLYQEMVDTMRTLGIVAKGADVNDFLAALVAGDKSCLQVRVQPLAEEGNAEDHAHTLTLHLASGTFIIGCGNKPADLNEVAEKWEETKTIAALMGEEPALLAYAEDYTKKRGKRRIQKILNERLVGGQ